MCIYLYIKKSSSRLNSKCILVKRMVIKSALIQYYNSEQNIVLMVHWLLCKSLVRSDLSKEPWTTLENSKQNS